MRKYDFAAKLKKKIAAQSGSFQRYDERASVCEFIVKHFSSYNLNVELGGDEEESESSSEEEECIPTVFKKCVEEQNAEEFGNICGRVCGCCFKEAPGLASIDTVAGNNIVNCKLIGHFVHFIFLLVIT